MDLIYNTCISWSHLLATKNHSFKNTYPPKRKVALLVFQNPFSYFFSAIDIGKWLQPQGNWQTELVCGQAGDAVRARPGENSMQGVLFRQIEPGIACGELQMCFWDPQICLLETLISQAEIFTSLRQRHLWNRFRTFFALFWRIRNSKMVIWPFVLLTLKW